MAARRTTFVWIGISKARLVFGYQISDFFCKMCLVVTVLPGVTQSMLPTSSCYLSISVSQTPHHWPQRVTSLLLSITQSQQAFSNFLLVGRGGVQRSQYVVKKAKWDMVWEQGYI